MKNEFFDIEELKNHMQENSIKRLIKYDNVAILVQSNWGGLVIMINSTGELVFVSDDYTQDKPKITEHEIKYNNEGQAGFYYQDEFYLLNEFMKK